MKTIINSEELITELVEGKWHPKSANPMASSDYPGLAYECGCGSSHLLSYTDFIMVGAPVKFVFLCENDYLTGVRVKGIFKQKSYELWTCKKTLYLEAVEKVNEE
jgi:hypothetical protein